MNARATIGIQKLDDPDIENEVESWINHLRDRAHNSYTPISVWNDVKVYLEVVVEKLDLRNLFEPTCNEFFVPVTNFKGWSDLNSRAAMMRKFAAHRGSKKRRCVLHLSGDHDPGGLHITEKMRKNLEDLSGAIGWTPENLVISRFGLNADFIDRHNLTWIDNLETSSGQQLDDPGHEDHDKATCRTTSPASASANAKPMRSSWCPNSLVRFVAMRYSNMCQRPHQRVITASSSANAQSCSKPSGGE